MKFLTCNQSHENQITKTMLAMLVELTIEANEESFVIVHQHGGNDVTCKSRIRGNCHNWFENYLTDPKQIVKYCIKYCMI